MNTSKKVKVIGFINPNKYFPSFVVVIFLQEDEHYARYPSGETLRIDTSRAELDSCDNFWVDTQSRQLDLSRVEIAFAFSKEDLALGTLDVVVKEMQAWQKVMPTSSEVSVRLSEILEALKSDPEVNSYLK